MAFAVLIYAGAQSRDRLTWLACGGIKRGKPKKEEAHATEKAKSDTMRSRRRRACMCVRGCGKSEREGKKKGERERE